MDEVFKHKHIVFGEDHYNPLGLVRSLGEKGIMPIVILVGEHPRMVNNSRYVGTLHLVADREEGYALLTSKYSNEELKPFLYTCDDFTESLLDERYDELKDHFYFFDGGQNGRITHFMDKDAINQLAVECGCQIPKEEVVNHGEFPKSVPYPIITKSLMSIMGAWKKDVFICHNDDELKDAYSKIKTPKLLLEQFIEKKNELCLDGFSINGGEEVYIPFKSSYYRVLPSTYGNYFYLNPFKDTALFSQVQNILRKAHFSGIFSVEFLIDKNDDLYFLEVNFRNSTWSYAFTYGGCNLPFNWAVSTLSGHIDESLMKPKQEQFSAMAEANDSYQTITMNPLSGLKWVMEMLRVDCPLFFNRNDRKPFSKSKMIFEALKTPFVRIKKKVINHQTFLI